MRKNNRGLRKMPKAAPQGKFNDPALTGMREAVFGKEMSQFIWKVGDNSERMRNDQSLLSAAEAKRLRKMEKRAGK